jgi:hypothetical protein
MFKAFLLSIVVVPVLLGMQAARVRARRPALVALVALLAAYDLLYVLVLHYLRMRWVG